MSNNSIPIDKGLAIEQLWNKSNLLDSKIKELDKLVDVSSSINGLIVGINTRIDAIPGANDDDLVTGSAIDPSFIAHDSLGGLQGGQENEYYHLTNTEHSVISNTDSQRYAFMMG